MASFETVFFILGCSLFVLAQTQQENTPMPININEKDNIGRWRYKDDYHI